LPAFGKLTSCVQESTHHYGVDPRDLCLDDDVCCLTLNVAEVLVALGLAEVSCFVVYVLVEGYSC
jgi:hypothetical protein